MDGRRDQSNKDISTYYYKFSSPLPLFSFHFFSSTFSRFFSNFTASSSLLFIPSLSISTSSISSISNCVCEILMQALRRVQLIEGNTFRSKWLLYLVFRRTDHPYAVRNSL